MVLGSIPARVFSVYEICMFLSWLLGFSPLTGPFALD